MKLDQNTIDQIAALAVDEGLDFLGAEMVGSGPKAVLRLVVDSADGVTLDQCSAVSRQASVLLDVDDPVRHAYTLEVSSPGLDRKLYSAEDYARFIGKRAKVKMQPGFRDHRVVTGELLGLKDDMVQMHDDQNGPVDLPIGQIFEARLEVDWDAIMKEGKNRQ